MWFTTEQVGVWNWMRWGNSEFDELQQKGLSVTDVTERQKIYEKMQNLMDEDAVAIWVTHGKSFFAYSNVIAPAMTPNNALQFRFFTQGQ